MTRDELIEKGWRPIETAPMDGTKIIGLEVDGGYMDITRWNEAWWDPNGEYNIQPDLWIPIQPVDVLIAAGDRVVAAFSKLGETTSAVQALILRKECEASMVAFAAALARAKGGGA